jgi:hypothetical protein
MAGFLLSEGRSIDQNDLGIAVISAARRGYLNMVGFLLSNGRSISSEHLAECLLQASHYGHANIVEFFLSRGPIDCSLRDSAITNARDYPEVLELLRMARVREDVPVSGIGNDTETIYLPAMEDVERDPQVYLDTVCQMGLFRKVYLLNSPSTVDLGGVSKQFLTTLGRGISPYIDGGPCDMPCIYRNKEEQRKRLQQLGRLYSIVVAKNRDRMDKFLLGNIVPVEFFDIVKIALEGGALREKLQRVAAKLTRDPTVRLFNQRTPESLGQLVVRFSCEPEDIESNFQGYIQEYLDAAEAFAEGISDEVRSEILRDPIGFARGIQGEALTTENLLRVVTKGADTSLVFNQKYEWLQEKIRNSTPEWREKFVRSLTGNATLRADTKITIREGWRGVFEIHTCFNSLDLPQVAMGKDEFLQALDAAISGAGYNTA